MDRTSLVNGIAEFYGDLNVIHPFREGNGRAQRLLFEHFIINAGCQVDWSQVDKNEWLQANIDAAVGDYRRRWRWFGQAIESECRPPALNA